MCYPKHGGCTHGVRRETWGMRSICVSEIQRGFAHDVCRREKAHRFRVHAMMCGTFRASNGQIGGIMAANDWDCDLMDVAEIARVLHVPISWVYERTRRRGKERIPHIKLGKYLRFEPAVVREWLTGQRAA